MPRIRVAYSSTGFPCPIRIQGALIQGEIPAVKQNPAFQWHPSDAKSKGISLQRVLIDSGNCRPLSLDMSGYILYWKPVHVSIVSVIETFCSAKKNGNRESNFCLCTRNWDETVCTPRKQNFRNSPEAEDLFRLCNKKPGTVPRRNGIYWKELLSVDGETKCTLQERQQRFVISDFRFLTFPFRDALLASSSQKSLRIPEVIAISVLTMIITGWESWI